MKHDQEFSSQTFEREGALDREMPWVSSFIARVVDDHQQGGHKKDVQAFCSCLVFDTGNPSHRCVCLDWNRRDFKVFAKHKSLIKLGPFVKPKHISVY